MQIMEACLLLYTLFRKMNVAVDVLLTEAMVALTAGAIAELQIRIVRIRAPAYTALVAVARGTFLLCFSAHFSFSLPKTDGVVDVSGSAPLEGIFQIRPTEQKVIDYRSNGKQCEKPTAGKYAADG